MRSLKQRRRQAEAETDENVLPLINVVFLMLIFFMIAGRLAASDPFEMEPPASISATQTDQQSGVIHLGPDGSVAFENQEMDQDQLITRIKGVLQDNPDQILKLKVDGSQHAAEVLRFLTTLSKAGVDKVSLVTKLEAQP